MSAEVVVRTVDGSEELATAYRIRGALIALRRQQAEWVEVEPPAVPGSRSEVAA